MLVEKGFAYLAFDTPEELDRLRKEAESRKGTFTYNAFVREKLNNSLVHSENTCQRKASRWTTLCDQV